MQCILEMTGFNPLAQGAETLYQKFDSEEEAIELFEKVISKYPNIFTFKLYEIKPIDRLPLHLQAQATEKWKSDYDEELERTKILKLINDNR